MPFPHLWLMLLCAMGTSFAGARFDLEKYGLNAPAIRSQPNEITFWFRNGGDTVYSGVLHAKLFFSNDARLDAGDPLLVQRVQSYERFGLGPGFETTLTLIFQMPDTRPGPHHFILTLQLDGSSPDSVYPAPFEVVAPDFQVVDFGPNTAIAMSAPAEVTWILKNTGNGPSIGRHLQRLFYSADSELSKEDVLLAEVTSTNRMDKDFTARFFGKFSMPAVLPRGYLIVEVDAFNDLSELNEQNNSFAFPLPVQKEIFISQTADRLVLSWRASYGDQQIEFSEMVTPLNWTALIAAAVTSNGYHHVEIPKPRVSSIYRLRTP